MISRIWHGWTTQQNADAYERLLREEILPGIANKGIPGYHGAHLFRRPQGEEVEFVTILWFDSLDDVRLLAGQEYEAAYVPPAARVVLARFDTHSQHYKVVLTPGD